MAGQQKTIFVQNVTILDCAILTNQGPRGQSWFVDIFWQGYTDDEGVLFDFSHAKRAAKQTIDTHFDHRLFVSEASLGIFCEPNAERQTLLSPLKRGEQAGTFVIDTYRQGLAVLPHKVFEDGFSTPVLEEVLSAAVKSASPANILEAKVKLREASTERPAHYFSYTHSLRKHLGNCQRFHGHSNIIEVFKDGQLDLELSKAAADLLDGSYLIAQDYIKDSNDEENKQLFAHLKSCISKSSALAKDALFIAYEGSQGKVVLSLPSWAVRPFSCETTIESIADYVRTLFPAEAAIQIVAYEGLQKGALSS